MSASRTKVREGCCCGPYTHRVGVCDNNTSVLPLQEHEHKAADLQTAAESNSSATQFVKQ